VYEHQRNPTAANPKQFPILAGHRLIAEFLNLCGGEAGAEATKLTGPQLHVVPASIK
jgi:hypothetical protein